MKTTDLTFPPQNWHWGPCHPSKQWQVPFSQSPFSPHEVLLHFAAILVMNIKLHNITKHQLNTLSYNFRLYLDLKRNKNICKISVMFGLLNSYMSKAKPTRNFIIWRHERDILHYWISYIGNLSVIRYNYFWFVWN